MARPRRPQNRNTGIVAVVVLVTIVLVGMVIVWLLFGDISGYGEVSPYLAEMQHQTPPPTPSPEPSPSPTPEPEPEPTPEPEPPTEPELPDNNIPSGFSLNGVWECFTYDFPDYEYIYMQYFFSGDSFTFTREHRQVGSHEIEHGANEGTFYISNGEISLFFIWSDPITTSFRYIEDERIILGGLEYTRVE